MSNAKPMDDLKPYPEYRDSGLPWLEKIPAHWGTHRLDRLFTLRSESPQDDDQRITGYLNGRVTLRTNVAGQKIKGVIKDGGWQRIYPGDFAISGMNAHLGGMGVSDSLGKCSPIYLVLKPHSTTNAHFIAYAVRYMAHSGLLKSLVNTIRFNSADFKRQDLKSFQVWLPSDTEQSAIVRFLDHTNRQIDRYIRVKKRMIALLNEQKQAIIHHAVTRGLDPNVRLKPSSIPWLGDIPAQWKVIRAKHIFREVDERSKRGKEELLSVSHLTGVSRRSEKNITMFMASSYVGHKLCMPGDLVINTMWAWMAALGVSKLTGIISSSYAVYRPINPTNFVGEFFDMLLRTRPYIDEYISRSTGIRSSRLRLYPEQFLKIPLILPPVAEQKAMVEFVSKETEGVNRLITQAEREIMLISEYRTCLIADVVTGQLDVREAAAHLPAVVEDVRLDTDDEEIPADDALDSTNQEEEYE